MDTAQEYTAKYGVYMTDKQPEALRLADAIENGETFDVGSSGVVYGWVRDEPTFEAADELRRLHEENQQWQDKCQAYIDLHDAMVKDSDRLYALNAELVEALRDITVWYSARDSENEILPSINQNPEIYRAMQALAKAEGK